MKGQSLNPGSIVVLALDGSMVYVEDVQPTHAAVVCLPEQPASRTDKQGVFTPGKVGVKKISPYSAAEKVIPSGELSQRNLDFLQNYETLRGKNGPNYVDRTPEEQAAWDAANKPVDKAAEKAAVKAAKAAAKEAKPKKQKGGPSYLQKCESCGEQPGHPVHGGHDHPNGTTAHDFVAPPPPVVNCIACGKPESDEAHAEGGSHKFISPALIKGTRAPKEPKEPKEPKAPREPKERSSRSSKSLPDPNAKFAWQENETALKVLVAANGKFDAKNSGGAIIASIRDAGDAGITVLEIMTKHPRPLERLQLAFQQLQGAGLLAEVK